MVAETSARRFGKDDADYEREGGPAFAHGDRAHGGDPGMTLRDWFAGQAIIGAGFSENFALRDKAEFVAEMADDAYLLADAMLAQRSK